MMKAQSGNLKQDSNNRSSVESNRAFCQSTQQAVRISSPAAVIDRWRRQAAGQGGLEAPPSVREKVLERENRELEKKESWPSSILRTPS